MKLGRHSRKPLYISLAVIVAVFCAILGYLYYLHTDLQSRHDNEYSSMMAKYDQQIAKLKAERIAKEKAAEAARKAAEQKAEADKALSAQMQGQVITPKGCAISGAHGNPNSIDVVVNKKRCFNPIDFVPGDLASYNGYVVSAKIIPSLTAMFDAAATAGVPLSITSAYRSYSNQVATYNNWVRVNGSTAAADTVSARPGYSEHQTGLVVDLAAGGCNLECFRGSAQYQWMLTNGAAYGFIERYPQGLSDITGYSPEAWHWRYVGVATAQDMKAKGVKTLEQYWNLPGGGY